MRGTAEPATGQLLQSVLGGFVRLHILYHAAKRPIYGVEIMEELNRHGYRLGPGTLYPILHRLAEEGYLRCDTKVVAGRQRKYYRASRTGRRVLARARSKVRELTGELVEDRNLMTEPARRNGPAKRRPR